MKSGVLRYAAILSCLILLAGCGKKNGGGFTEYKVQAVSSGEEITLSGNLEPIRSEDLYFTKNSRVEKVFVETGDHVSEGTVLARLVSVNEEYALAQVDLSIEEERVDGSPRRLALYKKQRQVLLDDLSECALTAPFSGVISEVNINPGDYTKFSNDTDFSHVRIIDTSAYIATVEVDELDLPRIREGDKVALIFEALPDLQVVAVVRMIPLETTVSDEGIAVADVELLIPDPPADLRSGYTFTGIIDTGSDEAKVLVIKKAAVTVVDGKGEVLVAPEGGGRPETRSVTTSPWDTDNWRIVSGLKEGDTVLVVSAGTGKTGSGKGNLLMPGGGKGSGGPPPF